MFRTVLDYYSGDVDEDAYDMRKALSRYFHLLLVINAAFHQRASWGNRTVGSEVCIFLLQGSILHRKSYSPPPFLNHIFSPSADKMWIEFQKFFLFNFPLKKPKFWLICFPLRSFGTVSKIMHTIYLPHFLVTFSLFRYNIILFLLTFGFYTSYIFPILLFAKILFLPLSRTLLQVIKYAAKIVLFNFFSPFAFFSLMLFLPLMFSAGTVLFSP